MFPYLIDLDLAALSRRLSRLFGCNVSVGDVREIYRQLGFVESDRGWLACDLRPLMLAVTDPREAVFGEIRGHPARPEG